MKIIITSIFLLLSLSIKSEEEIKMYTDFNHKSPIVLYKINNIWVNDACKSQARECLQIILNKNAKFKKIKKTLKGNPASEFCLKLNGHSLIFFDQDNNESDFCKIDNLIFDSWDVYYKN